MANNNLSDLRKTVSSLILIFIITFLCGFLKYTKYEFIEYIFFLLLFFVGIKLILMTFKSKDVGITIKSFLFLTGTSIIMFIVLILYGFLTSLQSEINFSDSVELIEGWFYLASLFFVVGSIGSFIPIHFKLENS